ncbi:hypothetical protein DE146DRAFT_618728 [Phaeosphaeria sp. MPI-PUGE-AT-0046c]|nr:hypothetical protein DE146DRAFT_618728 [Phaeosphaeria sp. MPI-PUGE-AT-0046c]
MPAISPLPVLIARNVAINASPGLQVVCAFPVSGQYGAGSRILYYVLVITCIFARKAEWLRGACLAAALVIPAVAALHSLVLASAHVNGVVDMDVFGAFQICAIAILAAPLTVRLSRTYFYDPGRNIIFLWTILILAGLIALCVEFYRVTPSACSADDDGNPFPGNRFPYEKAPTCGLVCSENEGPYSKLRSGANSEIFVIPEPRRLTFNAAMLLAAGFCIPAILSLIFTWDKILEINWKRRRQEEDLNEPVEGANVTVGELKGINYVVRTFLSVVEVPLFGGAVIAILVIGEANFFSKQVSYQTEPIESVGQWGPIVGTVLAALGSLYLLWYKKDTASKEKFATPNYYPEDLQHRSENSCDFGPDQALTIRPMGGNSGSNIGGTLALPPDDLRLIPTITQPSFDRIVTNRTFTTREHEDDPTAGRPRVRQWFTTVANYMGNQAHQKFDTSDYRDQRAHGFPEVPGENLRNRDLSDTRERYSELREQNSRAESTYAPSVISTYGHEGGSTPPAQPSPRLSSSPSRRPKRRDTLEVPTPAHMHRRSESH